tara:strand:+ start:145 stop:1188 length:1044 start_codon:yes stop_codon:yes gene_type:complete
MANAVEKVNTIAITDIEAINTRTDENIQAFNSFEFTGVIPYGGLTWTAGATDSHRGGHGVTGSITNLVCIGGFNISGTNLATTREYNGTTWANGGNMEASNSSMRMSGTGTAAIYFGGYDANVASYTDRSEKYNGTTWADSASLVRDLANMGCGINDSNCIFPCGSTMSGHDATNQLWDDTSWSDGSDVGSATTAGGNAGNSTDCIIMSGYQYSAGDESTACETLDGTTWSSSASNSIQARYNSSWGDGSTKAWITGGIDYKSSYGSPTPHVNYQEANYWNGTSWVSDTNTPGSDGKSSLNANAANGGNSGVAGAMILFGSSYQGTGSYVYPEPFTRLSTTYEATWG